MSSILSLNINTEETEKNCLYILHIFNFKKLALVATKIQGKNLMEMVETAMLAIPITPAVLEKWVGGN